MSYRLWWLIAFTALGIAVAMEHEAPRGQQAAEAPAAEAAAAPSPLAAQLARPRGG